MIIVPADLPVQTRRRFEEMAQSLANALNEPIYFARIDEETQAMVEAELTVAPGDGSYSPLLLLDPVSAQPMGTAPFVWLPDGRPDWAKMWTTFCELALYGGPPHRGAEAALVSPADFGAPQPEFDAMAEIRRGIYETTGLEAEPAEPGWIVITCDSKMMAAWLCATIILENVEARSEGERLYLPASWEFELKDEVKSVITVLAKTHHYWQAHIAARGDEAVGR
jgi:sirohydrochlorin cobaltochelatase